MEYIYRKIKFSMYNIIYMGTKEKKMLPEVEEFIKVRTKDMNKKQVLRELEYYVYQLWNYSKKQKEDDKAYIKAINNEKV